MRNLSIEGDAALLIKFFQYDPLVRKLTEHPGYCINLNALRDGFDDNKTLWLCQGESFEASHASAFKLGQQVLKDSLEFFIKDPGTLFSLTTKGLSMNVLEEIIAFLGSQDLEDEFQVNKSVFNTYVIRTLAIDLSYLAFDQVKSFYCARAYMESMCLSKSIEIASSITRLNQLVFSKNLSDDDFCITPIFEGRSIVHGYLYYVKWMCDVEEQCLNIMSENNYSTNYFNKSEAFLLTKGKNLLGQLEKCSQIFNNEPKSLLDFYHLWCALNKNNLKSINICHLPEQLQNFYKDTYKSAYYENLISTNEFIEGFMKWLNIYNGVEKEIEEGNNSVTASSSAVATQQYDHHPPIEQESTEDTCQETSSSQFVTNAQTDNLDLGLLSSEELEVLQDICGY
jgi:hypothetical protein